MVPRFEGKGEMVVLRKGEETEGDEEIGARKAKRGSAAREAMAIAIRRSGEEFSEGKKK